MAKTKSKVETTIEYFAQPLSYQDPEGEKFTQRVFLIQPEGTTPQSPVFLVLGNEGAILSEGFELFYTAYGSPQDVLFMTIEHRGFGESISAAEDQSIPSYVTIKSALHDYHRVVEEYQKRFPGPWVAAGYSYGGGLVINYGHTYPDDVVAILSSSGVTDWSFFMKSYDHQVRINLGVKIYTRLVHHINNLQPKQLFDENWISREYCLAFATGFSQYARYEMLFPLFKLMLKLKTTRFVKVLKWLDRKFALNGAKNYALSNSKLTLSRDEALTFNYSWRVWRWMQFAETGVFWQGSQTSSIYQRTLEDLTAECQALFKQDPPLLTNPIWNPYTMVKELTIPLIYVNGGKDPWKGVCLPEDFKIDKGQYLLFSEAKHCPDVLEKEYGEKVFIAVRQYLFSKKD